MNVVLKAPTGVPGASHDGKWYEVKNGLIEVPADAAAALMRPIHGFTTVPPKSAKPPEKNEEGQPGK